MVAIGFASISVTTPFMPNINYSTFLYTWECIHNTLLFRKILSLGSVSIAHSSTHSSF